VDVVAEIKALTGGIGADIAFGTSGSEQCYKLTLSGIKYAGTLLVTSIWEGDIKYNPNDIVLTEKKHSRKHLLLQRLPFNHCDDG